MTLLKDFEKHENYADNIDYKVCKQQLDAIHEEKAKRIKNPLLASINKACLTLQLSS